MSGVENLITQTSLIVKNHEKSYASSGQAFNFIHACNLLYNESILHTRFIGYLLNPKAGHFQKDKFLKLFLKELDIENEISGFQVTIEKSIGRLDWDNVEGGRIDVLVFNDNSKVAYAIEIKIFAGEQHKQLVRYQNYLKRNFNNEKSKVLFLTLNGKKSGDDKSFNEYIPISFSDQILPWIEQCRLASIDQPVIRETLTQYISAIKVMTNQNPDNQMSEEIIDIITRNDENFKAFLAINSTQDKLYQKFGENLINSIKWNTDLSKSFEIEFTNRIIPNYQAEISFFHKTTPRERIKLFWMSKGVLAMGIQNGDNPKEEIRHSMRNKLLNFKIGQYINFSNWVWFSEVSELKNEPRLTYQSWELFKSPDFAEKIANWVRMIANTYEEVMKEEKINE